MKQNSFSPVKKLIISAFLLLIVGFFPFLKQILTKDIAEIVVFIFLSCSQFLIFYSFYDFVRWPQKKIIKLLVIIISYTFLLYRKFFYQCFMQDIVVTVVIISLYQQSFLLLN